MGISGSSFGFRETSRGGVGGTVTAERSICAIVRISSSIGLTFPVKVSESAGWGIVAAGCVDAALLPGTTIWDPQRLQNPEPSGNFNRKG